MGEDKLTERDARTSGLIEDPGNTQLGHGHLGQAAPGLSPLPQEIQVDLDPRSCLPKGEYRIGELNLKQESEKKLVIVVKVDKVK